MFSIKPYNVRVSGCAPCEDVLVGAVRKRGCARCGGHTLDVRTGARSGGCSRCRDDLHARTGQAANTTPATTTPSTTPALTTPPPPPSTEPSGLNVLGQVVVGVAGAAAGGWALSKYVFKSSNFWATFFGMGFGNVAAMAVAGNSNISGATFIPTVLGAYGAARYVHGK